MRTGIFGFAALMVAACADAEETPMDQAEAYMWAYTEVWNELDTDTLAEDYWATTGDVETERVMLEGMFARMIEGGYDHSVIHDILVCPVDETHAIASMKFTRYLTSGEVMGPDMRATSYQIEYEDGPGWRIRSVTGADPDAPLSCDEGD